MSRGLPPPKTRMGTGIPSQPSRKKGGIFDGLPTRKGNPFRQNETAVSKVLNFLGVKNS